ncbi:hypothetical protein P7K49_015441 [Saguinus oedipus]|uniref:Uncharacterized protein n=1 Tax=Saguinus oedipus TaxID=9490 RepID=A0ABQ9V9N6_SAGOE|nr:hypothetical protein P7K49_015441 [Saguinus oedipus]
MKEGITEVLHAECQSLTGDVTICHENMMEVIQVSEIPRNMLRYVDTVHTMIMLVLDRINVPLEDIVILRATEGTVVKIILNIIVEVRTEHHIRLIVPHHVEEGITEVLHAECQSLPGDVTICHENMMVMQLRIVIMMATEGRVGEIILNVIAGVLTEIHIRLIGPLVVQHLHKGLGRLVEAVSLIITIHEIDMAEVGRSTRGAVVISLLGMVSIVPEKKQRVHRLWRE